MGQLYHGYVTNNQRVTINNKAIEHIKSLVATGCSINNNHLWVADTMTSWPTLYMWPTLSEIPLFCPWFCPTGHLQIKNHRQFSRPLALIQLQQRTDNQRSLADVTSFHREIPWNISLLLDLWISSFNPHTTWYVWFMKSSHLFFWAAPCHDFSANIRGNENMYVLQENGVKTFSTPSFSRSWSWSDVWHVTVVYKPVTNFYIPKF